MAKVNRVRVVAILVATVLSFAVPIFSLLASASFNPTLITAQIASPLGWGKNPLGGWGNHPLVLRQYIWGGWGHGPLAIGHHTWGLWGRNP